MRRYIDSAGGGATWPSGVETARAEERPLAIEAPPSAGIGTSVSTEIGYVGHYLVFRLTGVAHERKLDPHPVWKAV